MQQWRKGLLLLPLLESMIQMWGITKEQLHKDAVQAANARSPVCLYDMEEVMAESIFSVKPENLFNREEPLDIGMIPIYILTNQEKLNGAIVYRCRTAFWKKSLNYSVPIFMSFRHRSIVRCDFAG